MSRSQPKHPIDEPNSEDRQTGNQECARPAKRNECTQHGGHNDSAFDDDGLGRVRRRWVQRQHNLPDQLAEPSRERNQESGQCPPARRVQSQIQHAADVGRGVLSRHFAGTGGGCGTVPGVAGTAGAHVCNESSRPRCPVRVPQVSVTPPQTSNICRNCSGSNARTSANVTMVGSAAVGYIEMRGRYRLDPRNIRRLGGFVLVAGSMHVRAVSISLRGQCTCCATPRVHLSSQRRLRLGE